MASYLTARQHKLFLDHLPWAESIAWNFYSRTGAGHTPIADIDDLQSFARFGLMQAAKRYVKRRGHNGTTCPFKSYARKRVAGAIVDGFRDSEWWSRTAIRQNFRRSAVVDLDAPQITSARGELSLRDGLAAPGPGPDSPMELTDEIDWVCRTLPARSQRLVRERAAGRTMAEIGRRLGLSESRVSQIFKSIIAKTRRRLETRQDVGVTATFAQGRRSG